VVPPGSEDVVDPQFHLQRARAEAFGAAAEQYDRHRPDFPDALIDDLAALGAKRVLDVGCGTGKVARALARRGLSVLGVELDARMAAVARAHGVEVEVARFEEWDDAGRRFDLVTSGDAWHWIDPARGAAAVARVLRSGGTLARFFNLQVLDEAVMDALDAVYEAHAPELHRYGRAPKTIDVSVNPFPFPLEGPFSAGEVRAYAWERRVSAAEWTAFAGTISDHLRLPAARLARLLAAMRVAIEPIGEPLVVHGTTAAMFCRRERRAGRLR